MQKILLSMFFAMINKEQLINSIISMLETAAKSSDTTIDDEIVVKVKENKSFLVDIISVLFNGLK